MHVKEERIDVKKTKKDAISNLLNSVIRTLGIGGGLHTACSLAERVCEVDVSFCYDGLVESRKLADHLRHGLLQQVLLFALLYVLFTTTPHTDQHSHWWSRRKEKTFFCFRFTQYFG